MMHYPCTEHVCPSADREIKPYYTLRRILSQPEKYNFSGEKKTNFNLISLNREEATAITIAIFGYKEVYNVPSVAFS
jgi:hypothetical protein